MGLLSQGTPCSWQETKALANHVREHGITQFINTYHNLKDRQGDCLKWGDEVEYMVVKFDHEGKTARVKLCVETVLPKLMQKELDNPDDVRSLWRPEYAAYMVEGTPGKPYGGLTSHFNIVEANMRARREEVLEYLGEGESLLCLTSFPRLGCGIFTDPPLLAGKENCPINESFFIPDAVINTWHPRFKTLTRNILERRKKKVAVNIPIYKDSKTPSPFIENFPALPENDGVTPNLPDHIYMDATAFGMGCCCLQVTFQACNINEARMLYDQLTPLCPILMALSAASPVQRGLLSDLDCRWTVIAEAIDDRTDEEKGLKPLMENKFRINKSRYDSIDCYLSPAGEQFCDIDLVYDKDLYERLIKSGIDHLLAQHIAHLFIRDPISLFKEKVHQNDETDIDHFENIQSTNWQSMRFKPPPPNSSIGWRVEFRPMEVQMTEFENAAYVVFVVLLTRVILTYQLDFLIPISKVDENMQEGQKRDASRSGKFWFRTDIMTCDSPPEATAGCISGQCPAPYQYQKMTVNEIVNGKDKSFPGLIPLIKNFLQNMEVDVETQCTIQQYLSLIQRRAAGELMTTASWIRNFITNHPDYKQDSVVSDLINYDLLIIADRIQKQQQPCPELFGNYNTMSSDRIPRAVKKAERSYGAIETSDSEH